MDRVIESSLREPLETGKPVQWDSGRHQWIRPVALWIVSIAAAIFVIWRLAVFTPQPLDASSTLRPMLAGLFGKLLRSYDSPAQAFSAWYKFTGAALFIPPLLAFLNYIRHQKPTLVLPIPAWICSRALLFSMVALCLLLCRYPALLEPELNPDEGQFLASADKLFYDGDFFRADDCGTSGPVNIYPLMLPAVFGLSPDFASSRLMALALHFLSIWLLYRTIALVAPEPVARLSIVPAAAIFAVFKNVGLVEYSSEDVPVLLVGIALYFAVRVLHKPGSYTVPLFVLGFLSSAAFFSKLQAVPILAALALVPIVYLRASGAARRIRRPALIFAAGALPLSILHTALCLATGVWHDFWMSYIVTNIYYADVDTRFVPDLPQLLSYLTAYDEVRVFLFTTLGIAVAYAFQTLRRQAAETSLAFLQSAAVSAVAISAAILLDVSNLPAISVYLALIALATAAIYFLLRSAESPLGCNPMRWFGCLVVVFLIASAFSVYAAHRPFPHYLLFLFIPICAVIAWMLMRRDLAFVALTVMLTVVCQYYLWGTQDDHIFRQFVPSIRGPEGDFIRSKTTPNGQISVWGWDVAPYLASGRMPATRDTNMVNFFRWPAISAYYRQRFIDDLRKSPPEMFIDAVGPASFAMTDRTIYNFEQFPEIQYFVNTNYVHLADRYGERYYLRRDLAARNSQ